MIYRFWSDMDWWTDYPNQKAFLKAMIRQGRLVKITKKNKKGEG